MPHGKADPVILTDDERSLLDRIASAPGERAVAKRAAIVLLAADGLSKRSISEHLRLEEHCIGRWRRRFARQRIWGLFDRPRAGRPVSGHRPARHDAEA
jgi:hypothetical protein